MRRIVQWTWIALLAGILTFFGSVPYASAAPPDTADPSGIKSSLSEQADNVGYLENITFENLKGKERLTLMTSKQSGVNVENRAGGILVRMDNMFVPEDFRKPQGEGKLSNLIRVVPEQKTANGKPRAMIAIDLKEQIPYSVSQQGQNVLIDFNVSSLERKMAEVSREDAPAVHVPVKDDSARKVQDMGDGNGSKSQSDRMISLDFQDASIKAVLRLLAEEAGVSIVSGEDVKGNVSVHMKKVPWSQALDTILEINGLTKKQMGNVIRILTVEKQKKDEADRYAGEDARIKAETLAQESEQKLMASKGKLRQISIEAKIVEATDDFVRNLGVIWGGAGYGNSNHTGWLMTGGSNTSTNRTMTWGYPGEVGYRTAAGAALQSMAVNYPTTLASPAIGLVVGGAWGVLEAQLQALETNSQGKIISSPKITTMDNVKAVIKQGQQIPVVTPPTSTSPATVSFKDALLQLEVKPKITAEGKISMEIKASKDSPNYTKEIQGNYPIDTNMLESQVLIGDGETIVIGGVVNSDESKNVSGIPWLSKIPVLGWLFKTESTKRSGRQLMIFVTPRIIKADTEQEKLPGQPKG